MKVIEVKNLSKKYRIVHRPGGYVALRDVLANIIKKPFHFAKRKIRTAIGQETKEDFWALKDINFDVEQGEALGIIGVNGAGKSTLLKILSRITPPTEGQVRIFGRVSSLLEVGTGFHPELTGRENIFLNGAILGMTKKEIIKKFDDIVEFSGVEKFIDTPVKKYSSGMSVRLAFAIAAHLEPDILLIDEVLAVGDIEFQKKCLNKMDEVTKKVGRTILFVSHKMEAIQNLCQRTILLDQGRIKMIGQTKEVIDKYLKKENISSRAMIEYPENKSKTIQIRKISILDDQGKPNTELDMNKPFNIEIVYQAKEKMKGAFLSLVFYTMTGEKILFSDEFDSTGRIKEVIEKGQYKTIVNIPSYLFNVGHYYFDVLIHIPWVLSIDHQQNLNFSIYDSGSLKSDVYSGSHFGILATKLKYNTTKII